MLICHTPSSRQEEWQAPKDTSYFGADSSRDELAQRLPQSALNAAALSALDGLERDSEVRPVTEREQEDREEIELLRARVWVIPARALLLSSSLKNLILLLHSAASSR